MKHSLRIKLKTSELVGGIMYGNRNYTWISGKFVHGWWPDYYTFAVKVNPKFSDAIDYATSLKISTFYR